MTRSLLDNIESIPALPESVQELERIYHDNDSDFEDFQKVIVNDPLLTAEVLRAANAPIYGLKRQITDIQQAVALLGRDIVRTFVLNAAVEKSFKIDLSPYGMTKVQFSNACERQLSLIMNWLRAKDASSLATLAPAAFLVDIGRVIIAKSLMDGGNASAIQDALYAGKDIASAEKEACGAQATDVTATLFNHWHFEPDLIHLIRYSDDPEGTYGQEQEMAAKLKAVRETVLPNGDITDESIAIAKETIEEFNLDLEGYEIALKKILQS